MSAHNDNREAQSGPRCPICSQPAAKEYLPFCSRRCADVDLNRWLTGVYAIPAVEDDGDIEDAETGE